MRSVQTFVSARTPEGWATPGGLATRALVPGCCAFLRSGGGASTFLHPLARRALPRFNATMGALTPVRHSSPHRSPCFTCTAFLTIPSPTTRCPPVAAFSRYSSARRVPARVPARGSGRDKASRMTRSLAKTPGRIEFVLLRTGRSPPAALHPASRRRSCSRLQARKRLAWRGLSPLWPCTLAVALVPPSGGLPEQ